VGAMLLRPLVNADANRQWGFSPHSKQDYILSSFNICVPLYLAQKKVAHPRNFL